MAKWNSRYGHGHSGHTGYYVPTSNDASTEASNDASADIYNNDDCNDIDDHDDFNDYNGKSNLHLMWSRVLIQD